MSRLETGFDIGANINKLAMRIGKVVKKYEEQFNKIQDLEIENGGIKMENTVDSRMNPNYKMHILVKHTCLRCGRHIILSKKELEDVEEPYLEPCCSYCGSTSIESETWLDDPDILDELGCLGIGHLEEEEEEETLMVVMKKAYLFKPEGVDSTVVTKKELIHGAKEEDFKEITLCIDIDTMREWATEQRIIDQEEDYEVIDDRY